MSEIFDLVTDVMGNGFLSATGRLGRMMSNVPCDVYETDNEYVVSANVSEYGKDNVKVSYLGGVLTLSGEKDAENSEEKSYFVRERARSSFRRNFSLPKEIVEDGIEASWNDGILTVKIPKVMKDVPEAKEIVIN